MLGWIFKGFLNHVPPLHCLWVHNKTKIYCSLFNDLSTANDYNVDKSPISVDFIQVLYCKLTFVAIITTAGHTTILLGTLFPVVQTR